MEENQNQIIDKPPKKISKLSILSLIFAIIGFICLIISYRYFKCPLYYNCDNSFYSLLFPLISIVFFICMPLSVIFGIFSFSYIYKHKEKLFGIIFTVLAFAILFPSFFIFLSSQSVGGCGTPIDAGIKRYLASLRNAGEIYADSNGDYKGFCNSQDVSKSFNAIIDSVNKKGFQNEKIDPACNDIKEEWAACSVLYMNAGNSQCIDSDGNFKVLENFKCDSSWKGTKCP